MDAHLALRVPSLPAPPHLRPEFLELAWRKRKEFPGDGRSASPSLPRGVPDARAARGAPTSAQRPRRGCGGVGAGHRGPGRVAVAGKSLRERQGAPRQVRRRARRVATSQFGSSESPPPALSRARGGGGVRGTQRCGERGAGRVPGTRGRTLACSPRGICLPPPFVTGCAGSSLLQEQAGVLVGGWGAVLLSPSALPSSLFPLASAPISNPGPLNLITFPDSGRFLWQPGDGSRGGEECPCACVSVVRRGWPRLRLGPGRSQRKLRGRHEPGKVSERRAMGVGAERRVGDPRAGAPANPPTQALTSEPATQGARLPLPWQK